MRRVALNACLLVVAAVFVAATASLSDAATLYHRVDDRRAVHVSENPTAGKMTVAQAAVADSDDKEPQAAPSGDRKEFRVRPGEVTIYTTPTCPWCHKAKAWLRDKKIRYREIDVTTDRNGLDEMIRLSGQTGVPVIVIGTDVIVGFNQNRLNDLFEY